MIDSVVAGRYVINGVIGSGGMAIVYKGYDSESGEEVAVKVLRSEFMQDESYVRRFEKESQIAIRYSHKNIVKTLDVGCKEGMHYIIMEYVSGMTLKDYISKQGRLKPPEVVRIGRQICDALFYAHSHQLVHRDIKPQNILLTPEGAVKVADFGIAKAPETSTVTISGSNVLGSVHYISPEQARGGLTDEKTDIYSIGIVLYEMVTGNVPFTGDTPVAVALKHLQDLPQPPRELAPEITKALELVILKAISKEQSCRYDNAREMARDLERSILEPEGSYVRIKQPNDTDSTRLMHPVRAEAFSQQSMQHTGIAMPRRTTAPLPRQEFQRPRRSSASALNISLAVILAALILGGAYLGLQALFSGSTMKMPDVVNLNVDTAKTQLAALNLSPTVVEQANDHVAKGTVIAQKPPKDSQVSPGTAVTLTVSSGKALVTVPDVTGKSFQAAQAALTDAGLATGTVLFDDTSSKPEGTVTKQDPAGKTQLERNSAVNLSISRPQQTAVQKMPKLTLMTKDNAVKLLVDLKIDKNKIKVISQESDYAANTVVDQKPAEGTAIDASSDITLIVSNGSLPGYKINYTISITVPDDNTEVKVVVMEGDVPQIKFDKVCSAGALSVDIMLYSLQPGKKTIYYYFNDDTKPAKTDSVTFS